MLLSWIIYDVCGYFNLIISILNFIDYGPLEFRKIVSRIFHVTMEAVNHHRNFAMDFFYFFKYLENLYPENGIYIYIYIFFFM